VNMNSRTSSTGGRPIDARWVLIGAPNSVFRVWGVRLRQQTWRESHVPVGLGMATFSATDPATKSDMPVASRTSQGVW
jgi:hypothetical protein